MIARARRSLSHEAWSSHLKRRSVCAPAVRRLTFPRFYLSTPRDERGAFKCKCERASPAMRTPSSSPSCNYVGREESVCFFFFLHSSPTLSCGLHCDACWMPSSRYYLYYFWVFFHIGVKKIVYYADVQYSFLPPPPAHSLSIQIDAGKQDKKLCFYLFVGTAAKIIIYLY